MSIHAVIAVNRFGLGAKPDELKQASSSPKEWLQAQITPLTLQSFPSSGELLMQFERYKQQKKQATKDNSMKEPSAFFQQSFVSLSASTIQQAAQSNQSLSWRVLDFFSNHFSVSADGGLMKALAPTLELEAIAPHIYGSFSDMLLAVTQHPAMLIYLNNEHSIGPHSPQGKRSKNRGLNENLAREILELHTLGVNGGYQQQDVIELAKGITGWSVMNPSKETGTGYKYRKASHEPGTRILLGKTFAAQDERQGKAMLSFLANHPSTAHHVCYKLARHFISDTPSSQMVTRMSERWLASQGNLAEVMMALINSEEAWQPHAQKFKTPREFLISALRATQAAKVTDKQIMQSLTALGQQPFHAGSPAGYGDEQSDWDGASALMARIDWANSFSGKHRANAELMIQNCFEKQISDLTYKSVIRAESRQQALTLFLMSPEFQRR